MLRTVLTGDIVNSSDIPPKELDDLLDTLNNLAVDISGWPTMGRRETLTGFARRGGDGWQIVINSAHYTLRPALCAQAYIRARNDVAATRIAVATGTGHIPDNPKTDLNSAYGLAFTASGRLLDALPSRTLMAHADGGALDAVFRLADHISQGWTQAQARALCLMLAPDPGPRRKAAERLGISRQAVDQALASAGYNALTDALNAMEAAP
ncbi:MarR family transcriptional regulator [Pseudohalocynthiibacter aestuariivivens]|nr:MarR family transcriptional regulator [Pseudohalocynthiibacter aestuariivivens]QIE44522.1 MarR family transcriptional regulator [Pseudohalocynthiibacter aestuariivivens]